MTLRSHKKLHLQQMHLEPFSDIYQMGLDAKWNGESWEPQNFALHPFAEVQTDCARNEYGKYIQSSIHSHNS